MHIAMMKNVKNNTQKVDKFVVMQQKASLDHQASLDLHSKAINLAFKTIIITTIRYFPTGSYSVNRLNSLLLINMNVILLLRKYSVLKRENVVNITDLIKMSMVVIDKLFW